MNPCPFCKSINLWHSDYEPLFTVCLDCHTHYWADAFLSDSEWELRLMALACWKITLLSPPKLTSPIVAWHGRGATAHPVEILAFYPGISNPGSTL